MLLDHMKQLLRVQGKQWQLDVHFIIAGSVDGSSPRNLLLLRYPSMENLNVGIEFVYGALLKKRCFFNRKNGEITH
ncbi:hypothetical protein P8452_03224 [Trifolium repens]|nr:hypothetical protein P8452_03224 [Trifolium repens]